MLLVKRTSISLDPETYEIADRVGNLSAFVRDSLRRWNAYDLGEHIQPERADIPLGKKCFPRHAKGCCVLCWPDGPPRVEDWSYYCETGGRVVVGKWTIARSLRRGRTIIPGSRKKPGRPTSCRISRYPRKRRSIIPVKVAPTRGERGI